MRPARILETCLYVDDLAAARGFYAGLLGLEVREEQAGRHLFLQCGEQMLLLFLSAASSELGGLLPPHGAQGAGHIAFAASDDELDAWKRQLSTHNIVLEKELQWPQGGCSLYFRDPAGNSVELATASIWGLERAPGP